MYEKQEPGRGRKVQRQGLYSGFRPDGQPWPEVLIGAEEIGGYLRLHPTTVRCMAREGRLPAQKDSKKRWTTTKGILLKWFIVGIRLQKQQREELQRAAKVMGEEVLKPRLATGLGRQIVCGHCNGWGEIATKFGAKPTPCPHCEGAYKHV